MASAPGFSLTITPGLWARHVPFLRRHLRAAHRILNPPLREMSLALVGDRKMSLLHERFLNISGPTDVLTFPLDADARGPRSGEVIVCVPEARRQAKAREVPLERELLLYALHGLLHLCGYDDRTDRSFRAMHRTEDEILTKLGVGPVFAPAAAEPSKAPRRRTMVRNGLRRRAARRGREAASGGAN